MDRPLRKTYRDNALTEVLCQLNFDRPSDWNGTVYGVFFDVVRRAGFTLAEEVNVPTPVPTIGTAIMRYRDPNGPLLMHLSPDFFTLNTVGHYPGWPSFKSEVHRATQMFVEAVPGACIKSVGLRYINRFAFDETSIELSDWFSFYPALPLVGGVSKAFIMQHRWGFADDQELVCSLGSAQPLETQPEGVAYLMELIYNMPVPEGWAIDRLMDDIETPHDRVYNAFEAFVTPNMKQRLNEEPNYESTVIPR
jgi:uncharacterized protein (TIGR04255 family)